MRIFIVVDCMPALYDTITVQDHSRLLSHQSGHLFPDWFEESVNHTCVKCIASQWCRKVGREGAALFALSL